MTELLYFQLVFKYNLKIYILLEDIVAYINYKQLRGVVYLTRTHIDHKIAVNNS